jgi:hypothetical protein
MTISMSATVSKFFSENVQFFQVAVIIVIVGLIIYFAKGMHKEGMNNAPIQWGPFTPKPVETVEFVMPGVSGEEQVTPISGTDPASPVDFSGLAETIKAADLLPQVEGENPIDNLNFLTAGFSYGIDSQSGTNKNSSHDLRGDIPIRVDLNFTPFNQSTKTPNPFGRSWEIGAATQV